MSSDRRSALATFNFECHCEICATTANTIATSDHKRQRIREIWRILHQIRGDPELENIQKLTSEMLSLSQEENLGPSTMKRYYHNLMRLFFAQGDFTSAMAYAQQSLSLSETFDGPEDADGLQKALKRNIDVLRGYLPAASRR